MQVWVFQFSFTSVFGANKKTLGGQGF